MRIEAMSNKRQVKDSSFHKFRCDPRYAPRRIIHPSNPSLCSPQLNKILGEIPDSTEGRRTMLFSATMTSKVEKVSRTSVTVTGVLTMSAMAMNENHGTTPFHPPSIPHPTPPHPQSHSLIHIPFSMLASQLQRASLSDPVRVEVSTKFQTPDKVREKQ